MGSQYQNVFPPAQGKKDSSGVTISTNFGSGVSGAETENNSLGWPPMKNNRDNKRNVDLDPRVSPEMRVKAQAANRSSKPPSHKSNPMSKYVSAHNSEDENDPIEIIKEPPRLHKNNSM